VTLLKFAQDHLLLAHLMDLLMPAQFAETQLDHVIKLNLALDPVFHAQLMLLDLLNLFALDSILLLQDKQPHS